MEKKYKWPKLFNTHTRILYTSPKNLFYYFFLSNNLTVKTVEKGDSKSFRDSSKAPIILLLHVYLDVTKILNVEFVKKKKLYTGMFSEEERGKKHF